VIGWQPLAEPGFHATLAAARGSALVMIAAPGCGACRAAHAAVPGWSAGLVDALFTVDANAAGGLVREYGVFHLPEFLLFCDGEFHARHSAPLEAQAWREALKAALAAPAQEAP
jgi:Thioredoxin